ncbi:hypothetical protein CPC08DRAFT_715586 [Agrocybe pediades]|nr:hypothetical protein CPC08DRAFT_715586 [Agrocybe pediades]
MAQLAPEVIHNILGHIDDRRTLVSCRLVSKSFESIGAPLVWQRIRIVKPRSGRRIPFSVIGKAKHPFVKEIVFDTTKM